jgi:uncharacterized protein YcfJ
MKRLVQSLTLMATLGASAAVLASPARHGRGHVTYVDYAHVTAVRPIFAQAYADRRVCREVPVERRSSRSTAGTLLGAVIGGVLGNTIGKGDGRRAATVAGAVVGGAIGGHSGDGGYRQVGYQRQCDVRRVNVGRRVVAYNVTYRYHGERFRTRMDHDPGRRLRVRVNQDVRPAE